MLTIIASFAHKLSRVSVITRHATNNHRFNCAWHSGTIGVLPDKWIIPDNWRLPHGNL